MYYWAYPYNDQVVTNAAAGYFDFRFQKTPLFFMLMKFFPVSFLITRGDLPTIPYSLGRLDNILTAAINDTATIEVNVLQVPPRRWPEAPGDNGVIMHTKGATGAVRRSP